MAVTRERLNQGITYEQFLDSMSRFRERVEANYTNLQLKPEDIEPFKRLEQPLDVLVIVEDWCGDVHANLPILARIAKESGTLNLHLFVRDENMDLMDQYMNGEFQSIPVFAFFDQDMNELGRFIERPRSVSEFRTNGRLKILADHPEFGGPDAVPDQLSEELRAQLSQLTQEMRAQSIPFANGEVVRELQEIVGRVPAKK